MDRLTATKELLDRCVRRPNEQYAYSRCEVCDTAFWDREEHRFGCKLLEWREALRDQSPSQEAVRDEVLEAVCLNIQRAVSDYTRRTPPHLRDCDVLTGHIVRALKREPNAAAESYESAHPKALDEPAPAAPDVESMVRPDLVLVTRAFLQSLECPIPNCSGGWITNTGPDPQHDSCPWCEARDRFLAGDLPPPPLPERP